MESYLSAFQDDLGTVSGEIESLQNRSMMLNKQLENRKTVEKLLGPIVDDIVLPPNDVRRLVEGDVNDTWVKALHKTDRRIRAIEAKDPVKVKAVREVLPELEKITHKVLPEASTEMVGFNEIRRLKGCEISSCQESRRCGHQEQMRSLSNNRDSSSIDSYFNLWQTITHSLQRKLHRHTPIPCGGITQHISRDITKHLRR